MLADINLEVLDTLKKSSALDKIRLENVFPATAQVLAAENIAWEAARKSLQPRSAGFF
jgi:hypothetical protein